MEANYWHERWNKGQIGFHRDEPHDFLVRHFSKLGLQPGARIFVPLCGMSVDMQWLLEHDYRVIGAELHGPAVEGFFKMLGAVPRIEDTHGLTRYTACDERVVIYQGDLFALSKPTLGLVNGVYDRGAMVALPHTMRKRYASQVSALSDGAPQLLVAYDYDQSQSDGPPFSVPASELHDFYGDAYQLNLIERYSSEMLRQKRGASAFECVWCLQKKFIDDSNS